MMWSQKEFSLLRQKVNRQTGTIIHLRKKVDRLESLVEKLELELAKCRSSYDWENVDT